MPISPKSAKAIADTVQKATKRMSKAEGEAAGLYHPIGGGIKMPKPVSEYSFETIPDPRFSPEVKRFLSPEDFLGKVGIPLVGDRATAGKLLTSVEGRPLREAVELEGGPEFMMAHPDLWASEKAQVSKLAKQARKAAESGKEVLGVNVVGSPTNVDFNKMVSKVVLDELDPTQLRKKDIKAFNAEMRKVYPDFVGIEHPELKQHLMSPKMGNVRTLFIQTMNKSKYSEAGFPDVVSARIAVTEPKLIDVPTGAGGFTVGKFDPERLVIESPEFAHETYPVHIGGEYLGGLEAPLDFKDIFTDFTQARRMLGGDPTRDIRAFTFQSPAIQEFDQEWLDKIMPTYEEILKSKRFKDGGKVDLEAEFRKADMIEPKGYKEGGDLDKEFRKADMIDMSGFRQDPLEKATRRADNKPKKQSAMSEFKKRLDVAKEVGAELADEFKKSSAKEARAIAKSPKGVGDLLKNIAGDYAAMIEGSPIIPTLTGSSQNELAKLALTAMKGKKALEKQYANRKPSDLMGKELSAYGMENMEDGMLRKAIMGDAESMPIASTVLGLASPFAGKAVAKGAKAIAPDVMRAIEKATVDPYKFNIVKPEGGQFIDSTLKENLKQLKQGGEDNQINKALDSWIDSTLRKYVINRMGTESDEVRKLFDKGITHVAPEQLRGAPSAATLEQHRARLPASGKRAETEVGQAWEDASDYSLYGRRRGSYDEKDVENYPWLSKMAPEDMVYGASIDSSALKDRLGFGHVIDVIRGDLRSGKLRPEQLNKVSVEDAIKRTHSFNQEMAKKAEETAITVQSGMPVHREYPEGYKWVELKHPDAKKTEEMLTYEGDTMGHCVGSYCEDVMGGKTRIFSLRDDKGKPHVTIEVQPETGVLYSQMADLLGEKEVDRLLESGMSPRQIVDAYPELQELRTYKISQIKGKGNEKPSAKYIPFVQDFVKNPVAGKEWADVGDFRNTDLIDARKLKEHGVMPDADKETMNASLQELDRIYPMNRLPGGQAEFSGAYGDLLPSDAMLKAQLQDLTSPYLTKEDIINHLRSKEALPVEQSYSKYYENLPKDEGMAHGGDVHMAKGGFMGAVEAAGEVGRKGMKRFNEKLNKLSRNVAYNTYEQVPYVGAKHLEGMTERPFGEKLFFTEEAPWGSAEKDADLLAKYLGLESGPSQKGVGLYQPPIEGAPLEFNPQISSRTLVKSDKARRNENLIAEPDKASMTALGATRGYLDVQGASPWVRPSQGSGRLYNGFHISLNGKPTEAEMKKIGEIQANYGFWGAGDLGKSGVYVGFNPEMTRDDLNKMQRAFRKDIKEALGDRVAGVKMMKSEGDYPAFEEAWKAPQGTGTVTRQLMEYLDTAKEKNPLLAEYYAQKPSTELQKLMQEMNIRDIKAPEKYGVGAPREDVMKARDIFSEYGIEGLRDALSRGEYLPAAVAVPSGIELFRDDN